jgi:hypothetical protein
MTTDQELARELIATLRRDAAEHDAPPLEARQRVAARLAVNAGALALGASLAGVAQAAAQPGLLGKVSPAAATLGPSAGAVAPAVGPTLVGIGKGLVAGLLLGATSGLGLHAAVGTFSAPRTVPSSAPVRAVSSAAKVPLVASTDDRTPSAPASAVGLQPLSPSGLASDRAAPPRLLPSAEPALERTLAEQQTLLDEARGALRRGEASAALLAARTHRDRFPNTVFEEERRAVVIKALLLLGRTQEARVQLRGFETAFPRSLLLPSLHQSFERPRRSDDFVTDTSRSPQSPNKQ